MTVDYDSINVIDIDGIHLTTVDIGLDLLVVEMNNTI